MRRTRVGAALLVGVALMLSGACGGRGAAAYRLIEQVGVIANREPVLPGTRVAAERVLENVGQRADDESSLAQALGLACKANGYVPPYLKLGRTAILSSEADKDTKDSAQEFYDEISQDQQVAKLLCKLRG